MDGAAFLISAVMGYGLGAIPFGLVLTRLAGMGDLRAIGSGNIGATNVLRTGRKDLALATFLLDALKSTLAIVIARHAFSPGAGLVAGAFAFLGHVFPVWLKFKGGKGVATYLGCLLGAAPYGALVFAVTWLAIAFALRYSSAAALTATVLAPLSLFWLYDLPTALTFVALSLIVWARHRDNIVRLVAGTESKIGAKTKEPPRNNPPATRS